MAKRYETVLGGEVQKGEARWPIYRFSESWSVSRFTSAQELFIQAMVATSFDLRASLYLITRAIELLPNELRLFNERSLFFLRLHDYSSALKDIDRTIELIPTFFAPYITQANIRLFMGDSLGCAKSFRLAGFFVEEKKDQALVFYQMGIWLAFCGDYSSAKEMFRDASELDPDNKKYALMARVRHVGKTELEAEKIKIVLAR